MGRSNDMALGNFVMCTLHPIICTTKDLLNTFPVLAGMLHPDLTKDTQHAAIWNRTDQAFDFGYGDGPQTHREWYSGHHQWYVFQNAVAYATLGASSAAELAEEARNASQPIYDLQGIVETLNRVSAFRAICHAVVKYNIDIHELTANNMGVLTSGRLVILDTSVKGHAPAPKWGWKNLI